MHLHALDEDHSLIAPFSYESGKFRWEYNLESRCFAYFNTSPKEISGLFTVYSGGSLWVVRPYTKKRPKSGHVHGHRNSPTTVSLRPTTPKRASEQRAGLKPGGAGGHPPATLCVRAFSRESLDPRPGPGGNPPRRVYTALVLEGTTHRPNTPRLALPGQAAPLLSGGFFLECRPFPPKKKGGGQMLGKGPNFPHPAFDSLFRHRPV